MADINADYADNARRMPTISLRNGIMYRVDGNHTINVLLERGENITHCEVFFGMNKKRRSKPVLST